MSHSSTDFGRIQISRSAAVLCVYSGRAYLLTQAIHNQCDHLHEQCLDEKNDRSRASVSAKVKEYMDRAEAIQKYIKETESRPVGVKKTIASADGK